MLNVITDSGDAVCLSRHWTFGSFICDMLFDVCEVR